MAQIARRRDGCYARRMLIIDPVCPRPYSARSLREEAMGGTEATVIRLARALPDALVMQHNRLAADRDDPQFQPLDWSVRPEGGPIVVLRDAAAALHIRRFGWDGPLYLWLHDMATLGLLLAMTPLHQAGIELIAVSDWHRRHILAASQALFDDHRPLPNILVIPNPLEEGLAGRQCDPDPDRLVFLSSPHKGLADVLRLFALVKARYPRLELWMGDPSQGGGPAPDVNSRPGVRLAGRLTHAKAMDLLAGSFCMFYPNLSYPETFGIVYAEANALGVPVLAHDFGAASEVLADPRQLVNGYDQDQVIARFEDWRENGRPHVSARPEFALSTVIEAWRAIGA
ncbi:MAG: glycosyl transferase group 1 [Caulobacteraceae bacterium]|nr:glycosyl transferase group 1 [Caulobacteraceae bacterium]